MNRPNRLPAHIESILPAATQNAWLRIIPAVPDHADLVGGTALAVHFQHRISRDLDFFCMAPFDPSGLEQVLRRAGDFEPIEIGAGTLNGVFEGTKVQFLDAQSQHPIEPAQTVAGLRVAGLTDLLAMKLKVIGDRGELRDYFDLMEIEKRTDHAVEEGIGYFLSRFQPRIPRSSVAHIAKALTSFDDVLDDPGLPVPRAEIEEYWRKRQPLISFGID